MSIRAKLWLQTAFAALMWCVVIFLVGGFWLAATACQGPQATARGQTASTLPSVAESTRTAANDVREAANEIQNANAEIAAAVPEVAKQTAEIDGGVAKLRQVELLLASTQTALREEIKTAAKVSGDLAAARRRVAELEDRSNGMLNTILMGVSVAGLALAVVSGVWLRSWQGVVTGLGVFAACVSGMWIIQYRGWIAVGGLVVAAGYAAWCIIAERKAASQVVATVEAIKHYAPNFKDIANSIQTSKLTRTIVDRIKLAAGID